MDNTVTRAMLSDKAAETAGVSRNDAADIGQRLFEMVGEALADGESVKLTGFGSLQVRSRAERVGRNPRTGEEHSITPHRTVVFVPSAKLRDALDKLKP